MMRGLRAWQFKDPYHDPNLQAHHPVGIDPGDGRRYLLGSVFDHRLI